MGVRGKKKQRKLAPKLKKIREGLQLSQSQLIKELKLKGLGNSNISSYESGSLEPALWVLLKYAQAAQVCVDVLIDDDLDLPLEIPSKKFFCPHCEPKRQEKK